MKDCRIILASQSPRRQALLREAGLDFDVIVSSEDENMECMDPALLTEKLALSKALNVTEMAVRLYEGSPLAIIGSDTVVSLNGLIMGKPANPEDAFSMISMLQGRTHTVYTGAAVLKIDGSGMQKRIFSSSASVTLYSMDEDEIKAYIFGSFPFPENSAEWKGKAGAYGIQDTFGLHYIKKISGDYYTIVGLPVARLMHELKDMDII